MVLYLYCAAPHVILEINDNLMKLKVVIHQSEEDGFWADVPAISGCATQGETIEELLTNLI